MKEYNIKHLINLQHQREEVRRMTDELNAVEDKLIQLEHQHPSATFVFGGLVSDPFVALHGSFTVAALCELVDVLEKVPYELHSKFSRGGPV